MQVVISKDLRKPEKYFKMMTGRNLNGELKVWHELMTNQLKKEELRDLKHESEQLYIKLWDKRFPDTKEQQSMFLLFSMWSFRNQAYYIAPAESF